MKVKFYNKKFRLNTTKIFLFKPQFLGLGLSFHIKLQIYVMQKEQKGLMLLSNGSFYCYVKRVM